MSSTQIPIWMKPYVRCTVAAPSRPLAPGENSISKPETTASMTGYLSADWMISWRQPDQMRVHKKSSTR